MASRKSRIVRPSRIVLDSNLSNRPSRIILDTEVKVSNRPSRIILDSETKVTNKFTLDQELKNIPIDLSKEILSYISCEDIANAKSANSNFNSLINKDIIKAIKSKGFPRPDGAKVTKISEVFTNNPQKYLNENYKDSAIRGDIFLFSDFIYYDVTSYGYVFDGCQFIKYENYLPAEFLILSDNVPQNYWTKHKLHGKSTDKPYIANLNLIRPQINKYLIANAGKFRNEVIIPFTVNNKKYYLDLKKIDIAKLKTSDIVQVEVGLNTLKILF